MTVESKKKSVWKGEWRSGGREILRGRRKKERRGERKYVWEKAGVGGRVGRMRERERVER